jgi:hypothetical protein
MSLSRVETDGARAHRLLFITIHTDGDVSTKRLCDFGEDILRQHRRRNNFPDTGVANSIANPSRCCPRDLGCLDQAGYG